MRRRSEVDVQPPAERLRTHLSTRFGSLRRAFKALDRRGEGTLGVQELQESLIEMGISVAEVTGCGSFGALFRELDADGSGVITVSDLAGGALEPPPEEQDDWQYLTTAEKWTRWCDRTDAVPDARAARWQLQHLSAASQMEALQEKRAREHQRMRSLISQGVHKREGGLQRAAPYLPSNLDDDDAVRSYRREALESVDRTSKRIRQALQESAVHRRDLQGCVQALRGVEEEARLAEYREWLARQRELRGPSDGHLRISEVLNIDVVNMFCEQQETIPEGSGDAAPTGKGPEAGARRRGRREAPRKQP